MDSRLLPNLTNFYRLRTKALYETDFGRLDSARDNLIAAFELLEKLSGADSGDYKDLSKMCFNLATSFFNKNDYSNAADFYNRAIQCLCRIEKFDGSLSDSNYRLFADIFIDLSDAYMHLHNQEAATNAFLNATKAFGLIKHKTPDELKAASANDNFVSFRQLYETRLSTRGYLNSRIFNNHEIILHQRKDEKQVTEMFSDMFLSTEAKDEKKLDDLMDGLTFDHQPTFSDMSRQEEPSDEEYRSAGNHYITLATNQYKQNLIRDTIETLRQSLSAFQHIKIKSESDYTLLKQTSENLERLHSQQSSQHMQPPRPSVSSLGFFSYAAHATPTQDIEMLDSDELPSWSSLL